MQTNTKKYLLFSWAGLLLVLLCMGYGLWRLNQPPPSATEALRLSKGQQLLLVDSLGRYSWAGYESIERIRVEQFQVVIGSHRLSFRQDSIGQKPYYVPTKALVWKNYFSGFLGASGQVTDTVQIWKETQQKWAKPFEAELKLLASEPTWKRLTAEQQLVHVLVSQLLKNPRRIIAIQAGQLMVYPNSLESKVTKWSDFRMTDTNNTATSLPWWLFALLGAGFVIGATGMWFTSKLSTIDLSNESNETAQKHTSTGHPFSEITTSDIASPVAVADKQDNALIKRYLIQFYERYGDLYVSLQDMSVEFKEEDRQRIMQSLIEMALHVHALARQYHHTQNLEKIQGDLNVLLILGNQKVKDLPSTFYQLYDEDPEKTKKAYRMLVRIMREMGLQELEGVLLNNVYVPSNNLLAKS